MRAAALLIVCVQAVVRRHNHRGLEGGIATVDAPIPGASNVTVWIPSWPRAGSTTIFHMVMAAANGEPSYAEEANSKVSSFADDKKVPPHRIVFAQGERDDEQACMDYTFSRGCEWTWDYSCPAQPRGRLGVAGDDFPEHKPGTQAYMCCCEHGLWRIGHGSVLDTSKRYSMTHFGLFEPCHVKLGSTTFDDNVSRDLQGNCSREMERLVKCNFDGMYNLWGWGRPHTFVPGISETGWKAPPFNQELATDACKRSSLIVYKTISKFGRHLDDVLKLLRNNPHVHAVVPIRDPRAIYASWKGLPWTFDGVELLGRICKQQAEDADKGIGNARLRRVVMERLVENPREVMNRTLNFLGLPFGAPQEQWIQATFNASCDHISENASSRFRTCHGEVSDPLKRWNKVASEREKKYFKSNPDCLKVVDAYEYPL